MGSGCSQRYFPPVFASTSLLPRARGLSTFPKAVFHPFWSRFSSCWSAARKDLGAAPRQRCQGWAGDPQQRRDPLLDQWAPEIPVAHHRVNPAGSKAAAKPALAALSTGIGEEGGIAGIALCWWGRKGGFYSPPPLPFRTQTCN